MVVRLGIIGTGIAARDLHWPALRQIADRFEIMALANRRPEKAQDFAAFTGTSPRITSNYRELLSWPDVDAVLVAVPIALNEEVVRAALDAGKHVIVEKPIAGTLDAARRVVEEADRHPDRVVLVAENVRHEPRFRLAQRLLQEGRIGRAVMIHADVLSPISPTSPYASTPWRVQPEHVGGYLSDGGVHQTAAFNLLMGPASQVEGLVTTFDPDRDPTDTLLANIRFASGAVGHLTYSVGVAHWEPSPLRVYGTEGSLAIEPDRVVVRVGEAETAEAVPPSPNGYDLEFADFYQAITEGKRPDAGPREGLADLELIDAALRSGREGRVVRVGGELEG